MGKHFKKGSGCFKCRLCGKLTRDVNGYNGSIELCELCDIKTGAENTLSDSGMDYPWHVFDACTTPAEVYKLLEEKLKELQ